MDEEPESPLDVDLDGPDSPEADHLFWEQSAEDVIASWA